MKNFIACFISIFLITSVSAQKADSLETMIGQMIMIGIGDFDVLDKSAPVFKSLEDGKAGGIILFEKNISFESPDKSLKQIISHAQKKSTTPLLVSIDEEGGKVNRLKTRYGFPKTVSAQYLGKINNLDSTRFYALQTAATLAELGFNLNYAPVLDVNINPANPVIGKIQRSYSSDFNSVASHAAEVIKAHDSLNVATALKHFPGHGSSKKDTHLGIADVSDTWRIEETYPYKILLDSGLVKVIMTAHIVNDVIDEKKLPATLSKKVVGGLLRGFLGYEGVVISDDMQMGAISKEYGLKESIKLSINAGVDIVMFANNVSQSETVSADQVFEIIYNLIQDEEIPRSRIEESYNRIVKLKKSIGLLSKN
ncbi:MAG: glycoside hydrolase family 3 protein [Cyclobacteriaceae bacterium]